MIPFPLFIGLRYSLARKRNLLLSFVSLISMLGVSLGVLILIVALSVINGSITTLRGEALKAVPHVTVSGPGIATDWQQWMQRGRAHPEVLAVAPFIEGEAFLRHQGRDAFVLMRGVDPALEAEVVDTPDRRYREQLQRLATTDNGIILGARLAASLGVFSSAELGATGLNALLSRSPEQQGLQQVGFADFGVYGNDNLAVIKLEAAQSLIGNNPGTGEGPQRGADLQLRLRVSDIYRAEQVAKEVFAGAAEVDILPWNVAQASLFNALNMEKYLTGFMLMMIVLIGAVNIISTLVMVVSDKGADIAILRTMGASRGNIMAIFMLQGLLAGLVGTALGAGLGVLLASNITDLSLALERGVNSLFSDANFYLISHLRTEVHSDEVLLVSLLAVLISFLATLYPAYRASRVQPAEVLRYE